MLQLVLFVYLLVINMLFFVSNPKIKWPIAAGWLKPGNAIENNFLPMDPSCGVIIKKNLIY